MIVKGKYNEAYVYTDVVEEEAIQQVKAMCDSEVFAGAKIRIMPDVHAGAGCTIGTTMTILDKVVPNMVGVDIGCGMEVVKIKEKELDFAALDEYIYKHIPSGMNHRAKRHSYSYEINLEELACASKVNYQIGYYSIGSLGGGNHFIEVDKDEEGNLYLVVHSGSRHLGLEVADYYTKAAKYYHAADKHTLKQLIDGLKAAGREHEIQVEIEKAHAAYKASDDDFSTEYLERELFEAYVHDMRIMQRFADLNRRAMTDGILRGLNLTEVERFTTVHNYIDTENMILRKGAVSAKAGERLLIPINMRDGSLICIGKGNEEWNSSAPHGAGRLMSRTKAKATLSMDEFRAQMQGVYSTSVTPDTLDESPMAYKSAEDIVNNIFPTATIERRIYPVYNFKASEASNDYWKKKKGRRG